MGKVVAVCISEQKGTPKINIRKGKLIENFGLEKDAHAGNWHRQISLLSYDRVQEFKHKGIDIPDGAFGENLLVMGIDFKNYPIGSRFQCGKVLLEITQIGKTCHNECVIRKQVGDCIMPREGVFARVINGGSIEVGDDLYAV
jgi:MOSC domain-containing protein YiiM